ncbi:MAG: hypothetical protein OK457_10870 [Thaumarchaeota archaeon]|nr:hypothetical protein [Nitrososphaerota archaeon]
MNNVILSSGITFVLEKILPFREKGARFLNPLIKIESTELIPNKLKKKISAKMKNVISGISDVESSSGLRFPHYYVEPVLTVTVSQNNIDGMGVLYARTIPVEKLGKVEIVIQLTAPLLLFATKTTMRLILAHEFLHYLELIRMFTKGYITSQIVSDSIYEELFTDTARTLEPQKVFKTKKLVRDLHKKLSSGLCDDKLNEKCRVNWIEKGFPLARIPMSRNQIHVSMGAVLNSTFDPLVVSFLRGLDRTQISRN